ncbi:MAG: hypothetical protein CfP315_0557 [Candidatus Improbicoccus pseudotrichonymphae]|uniref:Uncharacterized protein n=1 Tax=Candidatus Improbicoccus pseudotrichonymphae TaxID=3033792 RepID=A0AA48KYL3_9FIRM|nr:MAG: hypothetical protein CfP315_0557 [Candidatus Improbicoccus pseudotrichonymphae]
MSSKKFDMNKKFNMNLENIKKNICSENFVINNPISEQKKINVLKKFLDSESPFLNKDKYEYQKSIFNFINSHKFNKTKKLVDGVRKVFENFSTNKKSIENFNNFISTINKANENNGKEKKEEIKPLKYLDNEALDNKIINSSKTLCDDLLKIKGEIKPFGIDKKAIIKSLEGKKEKNNSKKQLSIYNSIKKKIKQVLYIMKKMIIINRLERKNSSYNSHFNSSLNKLVTEFTSILTEKLSDNKYEFYINEYKQLSKEFRSVFDYFSDGKACLQCFLKLKEKSFEIKQFSLLEKEINSKKLGFRIVSSWIENIKKIAKKPQNNSETKKENLWLQNMGTKTNIISKLENANSGLATQLEELKKLYEKIKDYKVKNSKFIVFYIFFQRNKESIKKITTMLGVIANILSVI